jgi:hypothetical protein
MGQYSIFSVINPFDSEVEKMTIEASVAEANTHLADHLATDLSYDRSPSNIKNLSVADKKK